MTDAAWVDPCKHINKYLKVEHLDSVQPLANSGAFSTCCAPFLLPNDAGIVLPDKKHDPCLTPVLPMKLLSYWTTWTTGGEWHAAGKEVCPAFPLRTTNILAIY